MKQCLCCQKQLSSNEKCGDFFAYLEGNVCFIATRSEPFTFPLVKTLDCTVTQLKFSICGATH